jgi:non-specific serine/threonine protein kinase
MIPAEWLDQYGLLLKLGNEKDGKLQVSKLHNTLLEELGSKLNNKDIEKEIAEKKKKLLNFTEIPTHHLPSAAINAQLRPYQLAGFHWLQALHDLGWGGCLADDMGLGKTLQTITFLQFLKEKGDNSTQLIICPTSLIFNWESELDKFCPALKYHTYYGNMRSFDDNHFEQFDIILTTYGVVRIDIEHLSGFKWNYVILDESQAIKNPDAQVTKSLQLLNAKNRLILSGTPVQNNTYDLYAQFNFINPGFLGNREFFKREFAGPIDKYGDKLKSEQLRKMIYPFLLRRTKEQVATDLPDKTEMILWCSMNKAQRSMYDEYKNFYRNMLLKKIDEEGMGNSSIYVLEGLLRLRQICDHPALIKADTEAPDESVKTSELMREIQENSGGHKLLVFSQFTEMLHIIRKELEKAGVKYCYLDGSTPGEKRKDEVKRFQGDESVKVFLISLKAGGVGLNLTAADYVYIVDPWWNPAAEQQAIDRTHRIGQTRKIFAYKMICKDTVEEKILQLQQKKKSLADDLISEDSGFVKKLTKEDIAFLFS